MRYKVLVEKKLKKDWHVGDIVSIIDQSGGEQVKNLVSKGWLEEYFGEEPNKHVLAIVRPMRMGTKINN